MTLSCSGLKLFALLLAGLLSACAFSPRVEAPVAQVLTSASLAGTEWVAFAIDGTPEVTLPKPRLHWTSADQVVGTGGCNPFRGPAVAGAGALRLGPLASTGRACLSMPGSQEDLFFKALELTRKARLDRDQLVLMDDTGKVLARFLKTN
ncbi:MAG: META domain-containing protein [Burkholderiales bacterium]